MQSSIQVYLPYCPTDEDPPSITMDLPACFPTPPAQGGWILSTPSGLAPNKPSAAVARPSGIEAASSKEMLEGSWERLSACHCKPTKLLGRTLDVISAGFSTYCWNVARSF